MTLRLNPRAPDRPSPAATNLLQTELLNGPNVELPSSALQQRCTRRFRSTTIYSRHQQPQLNIGQPTDAHNESRGPPTLRHRCRCNQIDDELLLLRTSCFFGLTTSTSLLSPPERRQRVYVAPTPRQEPHINDEQFQLLVNASASQPSPSNSTELPIVV